MILATLLDEYPAELEADLHDIGIDLRDLFTGALPVRRCAVLVSELPPGARVWQASMADAAWTPDQYLLTEMIDQLREANWIARNTGVEQSKQTPFPDRIDRPVDTRNNAAKADREREKAKKNITLATTLEERRRAIRRES